MRNIDREVGGGRASAPEFGATSTSAAPSASTFSIEAFQGISAHTGEIGCGCPGCADGGPDVGPDPAVSPLDANIDGTGGTAAGKPVWTLEQVTAHLNRTGLSWMPGPANAVPNSGSSAVISYGFFETQAQLYDNGYVYEFNGGLYGLSEYFQFGSFTAAQRDATRESMQAWDDLVAATFVETSADNADINFGNLTNSPSTQAYARLPGAVMSSNPTVNAQVREIAGDIWISTAQPSNFQLDEGLYGIHTLVHEVGHALGLSHPGAYNAAPGVSITYPNNAEYAQDTRAYTVMSYFNASSLGARHFDFNISTTVYAATPLIHDIAAIQRIYGADPTTRTGDTVYGFNSNAGRDSFDFTKTPAPVMAIYDAGGNDTLDASGYDTVQLIDLTPGSLSSIGGVTFASAPSFEQVNANRAAAGYAPVARATYDANMAALAANPIVGRLTDNVGIAYGTIIENAVGGSGADAIIGNTANNVLKGNGGDDVIMGREGDDRLEGGSGADSLDGGVGADVMIGGIGNDIYVVDSLADLVVEAAGEGTDEVRTNLATYALLANFENLTGTLETGQRLIGNGADNVIKGAGGADTLEGGAGNDMLDGGAGADLMTGGIGNDIYVVDNAGDRLVELRDGGTDEVRTTLASYTLALNFENLTGLATTAQTLTGNALDNVVTGGAGSDTLFGLSGADTLRGAGGADVIDGGTGDDFLYGDAGADRLIGGSGADSLFGGDDADVLDGGSGDDMLTGGAGDDVMSGGSGADTFVIGPNSGDDRVTDFRTGDVIDWSAMTAAGYSPTITQSAGGALISFQDGSSILLEGVSSSSLRGAWFDDSPPPSASAAMFDGDPVGGKHQDWHWAA